MNVVIDIDIDHDKDNKDNKLVYSLYRIENNQKVVIDNISTDGGYKYDATHFDGSGNSQEDEFILVAHWPTGTYNNGDTALQGKSFGVTTSITVSGFQADSSGALVATAP